MDIFADLNSWANVIRGEFSTVSYHIEYIIYCIESL